ncbi:MAG: T9SS type A sorting domain-containing protein [Salinivirgaceae bacterium]|nr:T9SS type A sorting domain-containing protein [Salinivirgaceae bacterium]
MARNLIFISCLTLVFVWQAAAQKLTTSSGGYFEEATFNFSWSMGEPITETYANNGAVLTQGFQQSLLESVGIHPEKSSAGFKVQVYPNPTRGMVFVKFVQESESIQELNFTIYDLLGNKLTTEILPTESNLIDMTGLPDSAYFLRITGEGFQYSVLIQKFK